jgi:LysR family transcriptional activator of glutamate synthase operon
MPADVAEELLPRLTLLQAMVEHGHLSAAASAVGVSQPTATRWLVSLNKTVGVPLTARSGPRVELTRSGRAFALASRLAQGALESGVARAQTAGDPDHGRFTFGFLRSLATVKAPQLLRGYQLDHPGTAVDLVQGAHTELVEQLHDGTVDVALSHIRSCDGDLVAFEMFREPFVLVVPTQHRLAWRDRVRAYECRDVALIGLPPGIALRQSTDDLLREAGVKPRYVFSADEVATVRGLVAVGIGTAILPAREGGPLPGTNEIPLVPRAYRHLGLLVSSRRQQPPAVAQFRAWAAAQHVAAPRRSSR